MHRRHSTRLFSPTRSGLAAPGVGYHRLITYTQKNESAPVCVQLGWRLVAELRPRPGWSSTGRPPAPIDTPIRVRRLRWEVTTAAWDAGEFRRATDNNRDENSGPHTACPICNAPVRQPTTGRPARYCSPACRHVAYRIRRSTPKEPAA